MKVVTIDNWSELNAFDTSALDDLGRASCPWLGIAIGPESHEGLVRVNDILLQAGRVLPLRDDNYRVERAVGAAGGVIAGTRLQLVLFECAEELAAEVARANVRFASDPTDPGVGVGSLIDDVDYSTVLQVPFTGRRQLLVVIDDVDYLIEPGDTIAVRVTGKRWGTHPLGAGDYPTQREYVLQDLTAQSLPLAFYVGGTNEAECWDEITIAVQAESNPTGNIICEADAIGEIGVR